MFNIIWILFSLSLKQTQMLNIQIPIFTLFFTQCKSQFLFYFILFIVPSISWEKGYVIVDCTSPETALQIEALKSYKYNNLSLTC